MSIIFRNGWIKRGAFGTNLPRKAPIIKKGFSKKTCLFCLMAKNMFLVFFPPRTWKIRIRSELVWGWFPPPTQTLALQKKAQSKKCYWKPIRKFWFEKKTKAKKSFKNIISPFFLQKNPFLYPILIRRQSRFFAKYFFACKKTMFLGVFFRKPCDGRKALVMMQGKMIQHYEFGDNQKNY